jgi:hypothetical protein
MATRRKPPAGYYTRCDDSATHKFKTELLLKETRFREDHLNIVSTQKVAKQFPRNVLLAEETPRGETPSEIATLREKFSRSGGSSSSSLYGSSTARSPLGSSTISERPPSRARTAISGYHDISYTRAVSGLRKVTEAKLRQLEELQRVQLEMEEQLSWKNTKRQEDMLDADDWMKEQTGSPIRSRPESRVSLSRQSRTR